MLGEEVGEEVLVVEAEVAGGGLWREMLRGRHTGGYKE